MSGWMIYWLLMLDNIRGVGVWLAVPAIIFSIVSLCGVMYSLENNDDDWLKKWGKYLLRSCIVFSAALLLRGFVPSTKEACVIYLLPKIANNESVQNIGEKSMKLIESKVSEWLQEQTGAADDVEAKE